jgi:flagellar hook protein FlgE
MLAPVLNASSGLNNASKRLKNSANNIASFSNMDVLRKESAGFSKPVHSNSGVGRLGSMVLGFLEGSNIHLIEDIVDQVVSNGTIKANVSVKNADDEMLGTILDIKS